MWIARVDGTPVGFIQVNNSDVIEDLYVEPPCRWPHSTATDDLIQTAKGDIPGLCHDGHQSEAGEKVMKRQQIPAHPDAQPQVWNAKLAEDQSKLVWETVKARLQTEDR